MVTQAHREMARCLLAHGELVFANESDFEALARAVADLARGSPEAGKAWEAVLTSARRSSAAPPCPAPLCQLDDVEPLRREWPSIIELAIFMALRAELLGCPEQALSCVDPQSGIEIAKYVANWQSATFSRLRDLAATQIVQGGTERDTLAKTRFIPLLRGAQHVAFIDRHWGERLVKDHQRGAARSNEMAWLLDLIDATASGTSVTMFTAYDDSRPTDPYTATDVQTAATALWNSFARKGGVRKLSFVTGPVVGPTSGPRVLFPHDRHMRVRGPNNASAGLSLSAGFGRLRSPRTRAGTTWELSYLWQPADVEGMRQAEQQARLLSPPPLTFNV
jgi:hypothetical protein